MDLAILVGLGAGEALGDGGGEGLDGLLSSRATERGSAQASGDTAVGKSHQQWGQWHLMMAAAYFFSMFAVCMGGDMGWREERRCS